MLKRDFEEYCFNCEEPFDRKLMTNDDYCLYSGQYADGSLAEKARENVWLCSKCADLIDIEEKIYSKLEENIDF